MPCAPSSVLVCNRRKSTGYSAATPCASTALSAADECTHALVILGKKRPVTSQSRASPLKLAWGFRLLELVIRAQLKGTPEDAGEIRARAGQVADAATRYRWERRFLVEHIVDDQLRSEFRRELHTDGRIDEPPCSHAQVIQRSRQVRSTEHRRADEDSLPRPRKPLI